MRITVFWSLYLGAGPHFWEATKSMSGSGAPSIPTIYPICTPIGSPERPTGPH